MAFDEKLAERIRTSIKQKQGITEKKMFGGLCFLHYGNMCFGIVDDKLMVRVGKEKYLELLKRKYADPMDFTGRPLTGMLYVYPGGINSKKNLGFWLDQAFSFTKTLPKK